MKGEGYKYEHSSIAAEIEMSASALYDGGWRAEDRELLMAEYELDEAEADEICECLTRYEEESK